MIKKYCVFFLYQYFRNIRAHCSEKNAESDCDNKYISAFFFRTMGPRAAEM
jgi:hypothetical protein